MKTKDFLPLQKAAARQFEGILPGPRRMLRVGPTDELLRALYLEDSGLDRVSFYVWAFVQPLYVPDSSVSFYFAIRLGSGSGKRWQIDRDETQQEVFEAIETQGLPFLAAVPSPAALAQAIRTRSDRSDPYLRQAEAFSLLRVGQVAEARERLQDLARVLRPEQAWQHEMRQRALHLDEMARDNLDQALALLDEWTHQTRQALRLP